MCFKCIKDVNFTNLLNPHMHICYDCFISLNPKFYSFKVSKYRIIAVYKYDEKIRELLYTLKGCFDIELACVFLDYFVDILKIKYKGYYIVPAPSYIGDDKERGFNHVVEIFKVLNLPILNIIKKTANVKQVDVSKNERANVGNYLEIEDCNLEKKKILFVDDVYTTGSTVKACIKLLETKRPKKIEVLVIAKRFYENEK